MPTFNFRSDTLFYEEDGAGFPVIYLHGLLHRNWMQYQLAERCAKSFRAISLEFSGHGRSSASRNPAHYTMERFADETEGLIDHLGLGSAIVHGTSLGANVLLNALLRFPEKLAGAVIEMPVLHNAESFARAAFKPMAAGLRIASPAVSGLARLLGHLPRSSPNLAILLDLVPHDPEQAAAVLEGLLDTAHIPALEELAGVQVPTLVIGHARDPLHPFADTLALAEALPRGEILQAKSMVELRFSPDRLWPEVESFYSRVSAGSAGAALRAE